MVNLLLNEQVCLNFAELPNSTSAASDGINRYFTDGCRPIVWQVPVNGESVTEIPVPYAYRSLVYDAQENAFWGLHGKCLDRLNASMQIEDCLNFDFIGEPIWNVSVDASTGRLVLTTSKHVYEVEKTGEVFCIFEVPCNKRATCTVDTDTFKGIAVIDNGCFCQLYFYSPDYAFLNAFVFPEGYCAMSMWIDSVDGTDDLNVFLRSVCADCVPMLLKYRIVETEGQI